MSMLLHSQYSITIGVQPPSTSRGVLFPLFTLPVVTAIRAAPVVSVAVSLAYNMRPDVLPYVLLNFWEVEGDPQGLEQKLKQEVRQELGLGQHLLGSIGIRWTCLHTFLIKALIKLKKMIVRGYCFDVQLENRSTPCSTVDLTRHGMAMSLK